MATMNNSTDVAVAQNFSLCIPRVFSNISVERIISIFEFYSLGTPKQIDLVEKKNGDGTAYNVAYVHFNGGWKNTQRVKDFQDSVAMSTFEDPQRLVYDGPWFWIILQNKGKARTIEKEEQEKVVYAKPVREERTFQDPQQAEQPPQQQKIRQPTNLDMVASISPILAKSVEEVKKLKRENLELKKKLAQQEIDRIEEELSRA